MKLRITDFFHELRDDFKSNGYSFQNTLTSLLLVGTVALTTTDSLINKYQIDCENLSYTYSKELDLPNEIYDSNINMNDSFDCEEAECYDWTETIKKIEKLPEFSSIPKMALYKPNELRKYELVEFIKDNKEYYKIFDYKGNALEGKYLDRAYCSPGANYDVLLNEDNNSVCIFNYRTGEFSKKIENVSDPGYVYALWGTYFIEVKKDEPSDYKNGNCYLYNYDGTLALETPYKSIDFVGNNATGEHIICLSTNTYFELIDLDQKKAHRFYGYEALICNETKSGFIVNETTKEEGIIAFNNIYDVREIVPVNDKHKLTRFADNDDKTTYLVTESIGIMPLSYIVDSKGKRQDFILCNTFDEVNGEIAYFVSGNTVMVYDQNGTFMFDYNKKEGIPCKIEDDVEWEPRIILEKEDTYGNKKYGLIDSEGNKILNTEYDTYDTNLRSHTILFLNDDNVGNVFIDDHNRVHSLNGKDKDTIYEMILYGEYGPIVDTTIYGQDNKVKVKTQP